MTLGEQIKQKREEQNLSQEALAEQIGVSRQAISKWEGDLAEPTGANKRALCQALSLELVGSAGNGRSKRQKILGIAGWGIAAILLIALVCSLYRLHRASEAALAAPEPALHSVCFYNGRQEEVTPEAGWYNLAEAESILIQWTGEPPAMVQMFFTPAGTETTEQTELLDTKVILDDGNALLLSADTLRQESRMGHLYFELSYDDPAAEEVKSELFPVFFDLDVLHAEIW